MRKEPEKTPEIVELDDEALDQISGGGEGGLMNNHGLGAGYGGFGHKHKENAGLQPGGGYRPRRHNEGR